MKTSASPQETTNSSSTAREAYTVSASKQVPVVYVALGAVAVVMGIYLAVCSIAQASPIILADISIADVPVGGLNKLQASDTVIESLTQQMTDFDIVYTFEDWSGSLEGDIIDIEVEQAVELAYNMGRDNFFTSGFYYLTGKTSDTSQLTTSLSLSDSGKRQLDTLLDTVEANIASTVVETSWTVHEGEIQVTKGSTGLSIDRAYAEEATLAVITEGASSSILLMSQKSAPKTVDFEALQAEIYQAPVSASLDPETYAITYHANGVDLDSALAESLYAQASEGESFSIPLEILEPEETLESIQQYLFADVLGEASSSLTGTSTRIANVRQATEFCNETILMPDDIFSFYELCAPYSVGNGYGSATAYVGGKTVEEIAGGICQVASTIYSAVLYTELNVLERRAHQFVVDYLPFGMDATIYSTSTDFKFQNNTGYPIKLVTEVETRNGALYMNATLYGTKLDDIRIEPVSTVYNYVSQETQYVEDSSLAVGATSRVQSAYTGCTATVTRYFYDGNDNLIKEEVLHTDKYASRPAIVHRNTGTAEEVPEEEVPSDVPSEQAPSDQVPTEQAPSEQVPDVPAVETPAPPVETVPPVTETAPPAVETVPPVTETAPPAVETVPPVSETVEAVVPPVSETIPGI